MAVGKMGPLLRQEMAVVRLHAQKAFDSGYRDAVALSRNKPCDARKARRFLAARNEVLGRAHALALNGYAGRLGSYVTLCRRLGRRQVLKDATNLHYGVSRLYSLQRFLEYGGQVLADKGTLEFSGSSAKVAWPSVLHSEFGVIPQVLRALGGEVHATARKKGGAVEIKFVKAGRLRWTAARRKTLGLAKEIAEFFGGSAQMRSQRGWFELFLRLPEKIRVDGHAGGVASSSRGDAPWLWPKAGLPARGGW